ncbi:MAG TPA: glucose 1-dehydrogenase [Alphaproteobacteria bacterium]|jgi:3-oxoacyl-[acyl-carrier protein] reductase|nr:glucose 1-dehydrogenase [Alphaproteobacteria bacterium]
MQEIETGVAGRIVVITGAGQGIGRTVARQFAAKGAIAVIADRDGGNGRRVAGEIAAAGGRALAFDTDVTSEDSLASMVAGTVAAEGRIDVLINNAGIYSTLGRRPFDEIPLEEWEHVMRVNVTGNFLAARAVLPAMRQAGAGRIINISSSTVPLGLPLLSHYITSKAAVIGLTRALARELGGDDITVNAVLPGLTETEVENPAVDEARRQSLVARQCVGRKQVPDDLVGVLLFLASPSSAFMTGQSLLVDGGTAHL